MNIDPHLEIREYPERDQSWKLTIPWPQKKKDNDIIKITFEL